MMMVIHYIDKDGDDRRQRHMDHKVAEARERIAERGGRVVDVYNLRKVTR